MKKRILVLSYLYSPDNSIGALRPTKIVKKMREKGYIVDVFCMGAKIADCEPIIEKNGTIYTALKEKNNNLTISTNHQAGWLSKITPYFIKKIIWQHNSLKDSYKFKKAFIDLYPTIFKNKYDYVFSTYGPLGSVLCGLEVKKRNPDIKWICDFRDPICSSLTPIIYRPKFKFYQNKCCRRADVITTVSNGYLSRIISKKYLFKSEVIPNGFDYSDILKLNFNSHHKTTSSVNFLYAGSLYNGKRNFRPLFKAVKELIDEKAITNNSVIFSYAGFDSKIFLKQLADEHLEQFFNDLGPLSREKCLISELESDILLLSTWNDRKEKGVFPGKFIEYMMIGKPIIALVDGNRSNSEVRNVMEEGKFGITYESKLSSKDFPALKKYVLHQFECVKNGKEIEFKPNLTVINRYNYEHLIERFALLMGGCADD